MQGQPLSFLPKSLPRPLHFPPRRGISTPNYGELLASPKPRPAQPNSAPPTGTTHHGGLTDGGLTDRTQAPWEGSSVATVCTINLFLGVLFLTLRGRPTYFFPAKYSAVSKRNSQGNC